MRNRITYTNGLIILITALLGWLVGYFVRWDSETNRPYIEKRTSVRATVEEVDDSEVKGLNLEDRASNGSNAS
ncbi:hypothetical protein KKB99_00700 [bacterium]|nr:hypothetical protein [bacterium]MBU1024504.1 hypothetical protein [bacterium]